MHIMKFCGYKSRDAILRLKDEQEVTKMFRTAIELQEPIPEEDRKITFGIFEKNPTMLKVLPGVDPGFKRFLKMVEGLVPKTVTKKTVSNMHAPKRRRSSDIISTDASPAENGIVNLIGEVTPGPTKEDLDERFRRWFDKELPSLSPNTSVDDAMKSFTLKRNSNGSFAYKCIRCSITVTISNLGPTKTSISNGTRHMTRSCWLNTKRAKIMPQSQLTTFFAAKPSPKLGKDNTVRTFVPDTEDPLGDVDLSIKRPLMCGTSNSTNDRAMSSALITTTTSVNATATSVNATAALVNASTPVSIAWSLPRPGSDKKTKNL